MLQRPSYTASHDATRCSYFVSHLASQDSQRKTAALQDFLCVHPFLAQLTVVLCLIAVFLVPLGGAIQSKLPTFPVWSLALAVLCLLAMAFLWVLFSKAGLVPKRLRPWSFAPYTLWLEQCCINNALAEVRAAGLSCMGRYLSQCDEMIAFVDESYFRDLRCVYELSSFCKLHEGSRLLLLSLEWPGVLSPFKSAALTPEESAWLSNFRCSRARCAVPAERQIIMSAVCAHARVRTCAFVHVPTRMQPNQVRKVWGSEAALDAFVREKLPAVLEESKQRYSHQFTTVLTHALDTMFGGT